MTTQSNLDTEIATTILRQLGGGAVAMLGARGRCVATECGVILNIRGSRKCNTITITLDPSDTYSVRFHRFSPAKLNGRTGNFREASDKTVAEHSFVYFDSLHSLIESVTGLATSL